MSQNILYILKQSNLEKLMEKNIEFYKQIKKINKIY